MHRVARRAVVWIPRIGTLLFAAFASLFALDVFAEERGPVDTALALLVHLLPTFLVLGVLAVAWHRERVGALLFLGVAAFFLLLGGGGGLEWWWTLMFVAPPLAVAVLFLLSWRVRGREKAAAP